MAISRMQQPRQMYGLGSIVKKAVRGVKKIAKSPLGKAALIAGGGYMLGGSKFLGGEGMFAGGQGMGRFGNLMNLIRPAATNATGKRGLLAGAFYDKDGKFSAGRAGLTGLGLASMAPLFMKGGDEDDVVDETVEQINPATQVQRAKNFYSGMGDKGVGLNFMPQKKYVSQNFYAADGGRAGYANGQLVTPSGDGSRPGYAGEEGILSTIKNFPKNLKSGLGQIFSGETSAYLGGDQEKINEILTKKGYGIDLEPDVINMIIDMNKKGIDIDTISSVTGTDSSSVSNIIDMLNMNIEQKAYGGRIGKQEGGIMATDEASEMIDMGGMEKDYRNEGGFVAMGGKERADDVPARLSKNEFVFTADAVRNAGGGDIDKGAEVMENLMSNLEQGGEISEDSQGLEGAQAMYDQQQMLQSRVV